MFDTAAKLRAPYLSWSGERYVTTVSAKDLGAMAHQGRVAIVRARSDALPRGGGKVLERSA